MASRGHTSFSFLAQGFCAFRKLSSASLVSLKPPIICLWNASFCQFLIFSKSSFISEAFTSRCRSLTRSASDMKAIQAFSRVPYCGPGREGEEWWLLGPDTEPGEGDLAVWLPGWPGKMFSSVAGMKKRKRSWSCWHSFLRKMGGLHPFPSFEVNRPFKKK